MDQVKMVTRCSTSIPEITKHTSTSNAAPMKASGTSTRNDDSTEAASV
eukprot:CAMPEP_0115226222 /NCGR_PEP_ID=MMETSP0270-20121206/30515_1 /TAXON_ID=71861 /ORGANISM="Scrippsiella trochoidea, Strain CCMP3099" /LENGTH=47 /DNA_ID= /DNA_START= /DNA_END= /DNA_ORIENTATION=